MEKKLTAIHNSNERMLATLQLLAVSPADRLNHQEGSLEIENGSLCRRNTDATLVGLPSDLAEGDQNMFAEDDSRLLQQLFVRIFAAWLSQMSSTGSNPSDVPNNLAIPKPAISSIASGCSPYAPASLIPTQNYTWTTSHTRPRRSSSPGPTDIPSPLSATQTGSSEVSQASEPPIPSSRSESTSSVYAFSEAPTLNETVSMKLLEAVIKKDISWMNTLIDKLHSDIEFRGSCDKNMKTMTPLLLAVKVGELETVKFLLSKGANIEGKDESGTTPLILAASSDNINIMQELLDRGADVRAKDNCQRTALHVSINDKSPSAISFLLQRYSDTTLADHLKPDIDAKAERGRTPLHYCAELNNLEETARMLLDRNADLEAKNVAGLTPAYYAVKWRKYFVVALFVERGADFSFKLPPTSREIENLLKQDKQTTIAKVNVKNETARERSKSEAEGQSRRASLLFLPSLKSRRRSAN